MIKAPYGTWSTPIDSKKATSAVVHFQDLVVDQDDVYWSEMRPDENGRYVIVRKTVNGEVEDILDAPFNARTRVHEYGGAAFTVKNGIVYFTNFDDQRLYTFKPGSKPQALTQEGIFFADFHVTPFGIIAIGESHLEKEQEPENFIAKIDPQTGQVTKIAQGFDFYSSIAINEDFSKIAWISWNHPNMPWDNTTLWMADLTKDGLKHNTQVDSDNPDQAFFQPLWQKNKLTVSTDKDDWWNLYHVRDGKLEKVFDVKSEIGQPLWRMGASRWGYLDGNIVSAYSDNGPQKLFISDGGNQVPIDGIPYSSFSNIRITKDKIFTIASAADKPSAVISLDKTGKFNIIKENMHLDVDQNYLTTPLHVDFPTTDGKGQAYALVYLPKNGQYDGLEGERPPLIVKTHGGPTSSCSSALNLEIQYWTSHGYAVADLNYRGSTGYGRAFRLSLYNNWGIYDVEDSVACAKHLAKEGLVDESRLAITGGSAGGYTTLATLTFKDDFHVGASHYGVSDLGALAQDTHKFESRYLDKLIGPYPAQKALYEQRSPICHIEMLNAPVVFFQGDQDKIVPPDQAQRMYEALQLKGIKTKLFIFEGEQHGFRQSKNKVTALDQQRAFFNQVFVNDLSLAEKKSVNMGDAKPITPMLSLKKDVQPQVDDGQVHDRHPNQAKGDTYRLK